LIAVIDSFCLLQVIDHFFQFAFNFYIRKHSNFTCKLFTYMIYAFGPMSAWLLVFVSVERFISISMPSSRIATVFKRPSFQFKAFGLIFLFNLLTYSPFLVFVENKCVSSEKNNGSTNQTDLDSKYCCDFRDLNSQQILSLFDAFNSSLVPFFLMLLCSILIIIILFKSRLRLIAKHKAQAQQNSLQIQQQQQQQNRNRLKRDIQFALTSIYMNILFVAFNLPICVALFLRNVTDLLYLIMVDVYYSSYVLNFFIYIAFNSMYRQELFFLMGFIESNQ
jgi:hypothetical protein